MNDSESVSVAEPQGELELAHEVNLSLLKVILYRQQRKFYLSLGLLFLMVSAVVGLLIMSATKAVIDESVQDLMLILLTAAATTQAKLADFWFNSSSDDASLVRQATSYSINGTPPLNDSPKLD